MASQNNRKRNNRNRNRTRRKSDQAERDEKPMTLNAFVALVTGGIHTIEPVTAEPETRISRWGLYLVTNPRGVRTRYLVGRANGEGRVSSPIKTIDVAERTATSQSGRLYRLVGHSGFDSDGCYVFNSWLRATQTTLVREVTPALQRLLNARAGNPLPGANTDRQSPTLHQSRKPL